MDCPKFTPNIFYPSKCRQCFKCREDHQIQLDDSATGPTGDVLKCSHLFIAPPDYSPQDPHSRNKRWQRRWFILFQQNQGQGLLSYALDDHPEALPQGKVDLGSVTELRSGEELTGHEYSFVLKLTASSVFLKGSTSDESRKWIRLLSKFVPNSEPALINGPSLRRSASSVSPGSGPLPLDEFRPVLSSPMKPSPGETEIRKPVVGKTGLVKLCSYNPTYESTKTEPKKTVAPNLRGDPDGGEQLVTVDGVHGGGTGQPNRWVKTPAPPMPVSTVRTKLEQLKLQLASRKWDLDKVCIKDPVLKTDRVLVDTMKLQLNSYFLEIDKLSYSLNAQETEIRSALKAKEVRVTELEAKIASLSPLPLQNTLLTEENRLLVTRINDLTEKFYNMEKNSKVLKNKLHRYRTNSLKDKDLEQEVTSKVAQLESRLNAFLAVPLETPPASPSCSSEKKSLVGVILKLNELEQRLDTPQAFNPSAAEWYKCGNCDFLQDEIVDRDAKLTELETMVTTLEATLDHAQSIRTKYESEVAEVQGLCADSIKALESSYNRLVAEIEEKHQLEMVQFELAKEHELEEETRATRETLEMLKRTYEAELANGVAEAREALRKKYVDRGTALTELHERHQQETEGLREKVNQLALKYTEKCVECGQLQEALMHGNAS